MSETVHDPFLLALLALQATERLVVRTSVALAFVRSPLLTAYTAWDLSKMSGGRFHLGLGSQIRQNIEERYAMPWTAPAAAMREYVGVVRARSRRFARANSSHTRVSGTGSSGCSPTSTGPRHADAHTAVYLGGVGQRMLRVAGECADGLVTHPTNSDPRYLADECVPALAEGAATAGRALTASTSSRACR
ncbi:LLM class flavin-dependent oxidoreductase [Rhodococcus hoagii]|nr:LLM class flavin-dependent oxidoreductase [Prescottella equi]